VQKSLEKLSGEDKKRFRSLITVGKKRKADINTIRKMIVESGGLDASLTLHGKFIAESFENIDKLAVRNKYKNIFSGIIRKVNEINITL
jgi:geranylgeranyl pyrophosphate synthase